MLPKVIQISVGEGEPQSHSFLTTRWASVTKALEDCSELTIVQPSEDIGSILKEINPSAVVVLAGSWESYADDLVSQTPALKEYAENGGKVVYSGLFAALCAPNNIREIFGEDGFKVSWAFGGFVMYSSSGKDVHGILNRDASVYTNDSLNLQSAQLPDKIGPFRPLVVLVNDPAHVLYKVVEPTKFGVHEAVGTMAQVGKGYVGIWGDRDNDVAETVKVIISMIGLPVQKQQ